jgi:hypothetical protein
MKKVYSTISILCISLFAFGQNNTMSMYLHGGFHWTRSLGMGIEYERTIYKKMNMEFHSNYSEGERDYFSQKSLPNAKNQENKFDIGTGFNYNLFKEKNDFQLKLGMSVLYQQIQYGYYKNVEIFNGNLQKVEQAEYKLNQITPSFNAEYLMKINDNLNCGFWFQLNKNLNDTSVFFTESVTNYSSQGLTEGSKSGQVNQFFSLGFNFKIGYRF